MSGDPGTTVLDNIVALRRQSLEVTRQAVPLERIQLIAEARTERRDFASALVSKNGSNAKSNLRVIAELKRASPSRGLLCHYYRRKTIASGYAQAGASALSVLTEEHYFLGAAQDLVEARRVIDIPVLRKDFILESYQVYESVAIGADALLLIVAILSDFELKNLLDLCRQLKIAALVEVHTEEELRRAAAAGAKIIGVNNRNLKTLQVNLETSFILRPKMPSGCVAVSESGIKTAADLRRIQDAGFNAVLIGERFMTQPSPGAALGALLAEFGGSPSPGNGRSAEVKAR
jgi:indole-3-glycerol phosphate synthase